MKASKKEKARKVNQYFEPFLISKGFKYLQSKNIFSRDFGEIQQIIEFKQDVFCDDEFIPVFTIYSNKLASLRKKEFYIIDSFRPNLIPGWNLEPMTKDDYNLCGEKSDENLQKMIEKLNAIVIPFLNRISNFQEILDFYLLPLDFLHRRNTVFDICLFTKSEQNTLKTIQTFKKFRDSSPINYPDYSLAKLELEMMDILNPILSKNE